MSMVLILVWFLNLGISFWNARVVGLMWAETKYYGGWPRVMAWAGAVMAAVGFTWVILVVVGFGAVELGKISMADAIVFFHLGYLLIIPFALLSGLLIWVDSLIQAWQRRDFASAGVAAWNTFAQIHNTYSAFKGVPEAWESVSDYFSSKDSDSKKGNLLVILVVISVLSGVLITIAIIYHYAGSRKLETSPA